MKLKGQLFGVIVLLIIWASAAAFIHEPVLLPSPADVAHVWIAQALSVRTYQIIGDSLGRLALSLIMVVILSHIIAYTMKLSQFFRGFFGFLLSLIKTIPNIAIIFLALIWLGKQGSILLVALLVLLPLMVEQLVVALDHYPKSLRDATVLFAPTYLERFLFLYFPYEWRFFLSSLNACFALGLKVLVMAELLNGLQTGIGFYLQYARLNLETSQIFSWTIWMVLISVLFDAGMQRLARLHEQ